MTKFGMHGFTEALRQEVTQRYVRVGLLEPGAVDTELASHKTGEVLEVINAARTIPEPLQPQDIAENIAFMVTRPRRSSIAKLWAMPTSQA
jgi:NADP-dependent 3-hydroxy acid dehydrogenase YdfG